MTAYYLDASALVKRYAEEPGSDWILRIVELTQDHRLRGYDAVQLATALVTNAELVAQEYLPLIFIAGDEDLLAAAEAEYLSTENPLNQASKTTSRR
ncbi:MAG: type II toxin-antitoxin system VapC family toxin [Chloroflexota bacterium]|nr:type II toxin-antitoxin system VapC family toxin [Chloroflexota bacterium]